MAARKQPLKVVYTYDAAAELRGIYRYNAQHRSSAQAIRYETFLIAGIDKLATDYAKGKTLENFPELKSATLKLRSKGDGHVVIYQVDEVAQTVNVLHLYHTRMDMQGRLKREFE